MLSGLRIVICTFALNATVLLFISCTFYGLKDIDQPDMGFSHEINVSPLFRTQNETGQALPKSYTYKTNPPKTIIQYGKTRTATTLQFQIICAFMAITHESEMESISCNFEGDISSYKYNVIKTHNISQYLQLLPLDSWVFLTSGRNSKMKKEMVMLEKYNIYVPFIADYDMVLQIGHLIALKYRAVFGASREQTQRVVDYLRYWEILRMCCGMQMSETFRKRLHKNDQSRSWTGIKRHPCEELNIRNIEKTFINTYIFRHFAHIKSLRDVIAKPSTIDGDLDGTYCERCNKEISSKLLTFNQNCS